MPGAPGFGPQLQQTNQNAANYMNSALQSALGTGPQQSYSIGSLDQMGRPPQQQMSAAVMPPMQGMPGMGGGAPQQGTPGLQLQDQIQAMQQQQQGLPLGTQQVPQYPGSLSDPGTQRMIQEQAQALQRQQAMLAQMPGTLGGFQQQAQMSNSQYGQAQVDALRQQMQQMQAQYPQPTQAQLEGRFQPMVQPMRAIDALALQAQNANQAQPGQINAQLPSPTQQPPALSRTQQLRMDARAQAELNRQHISTMQQNLGPRSDAPMYTPPASPAQRTQAQPTPPRLSNAYSIGNRATPDFGGRQQVPQYQSPRPSMPQRPQMPQTGPFGGGGLGALNANQQALMQRFGRTGG